MKVNSVIVFVIMASLLSSCVDGIKLRNPFRSKPKVGHKPPAHPPATNPHHNPGGSTPGKVGWNPPGGHAPTGGAFGQQNHPAYTQSHPYSASGAYGHNPNYGHSGYHGNPQAAAPVYNPQVGAYAQPQTIIVQQGTQSSSSPGLGTFFLAGATGYAIGHSIHGGSQDSGKTGNTVINNYYNGTSGTASNASVPNANATGGNVGAVTASNTAQQELKFTSPTNIDTFKHEIEELSEILLTNDVNNVFKQKYITTNFQGLKTNASTTDDASDNLLTVKKPTANMLLQGVGSGASDRKQVVAVMADNTMFMMENTSDEDQPPWNISTIKALLALHDNYILDATENETVTEQQRDEESRFIDAVVDTGVMMRTKDFLVQKGYVPNDTFEFKNALKNMWFTRLERVKNITGGSGFEYVFLAERFQNQILGLHNWIYYARREADNQLNYLGYIGNVSLGEYGTFAKVRSRLNDTISDVTTLFIGFSPELEMSLYTLCFYISPNAPCPIKLAGNGFSVYVIRRHYHDKDVVVSVDVEYEPPSAPLPSPGSNIVEKKQAGSAASHIYSTIFQTKIHILLLIILFKLF